MIPICYSGNSKIFHGIVLSVLSLLKQTESSLTIYIATMDLSDVDARFMPINEKQISALREIVKEKNQENDVVRIDLTSQFKEEFLNSKNIKTNYTPYTLLRLLLDKVDVPKKMLYLDVDTMCCSDIKELYDIDIENYEFAAVRDIVGHVWIRRSYCNAGVMLFNFEMIKKTGLFIKARRRVNRTKMFMPDQTSLNFLCKSKLILPYKFNEQRKIKPDTVVKHFCKGFKWYGPFFRLYNYKQWDRENVHGKLGIFDFDDLYELYDELDKKYDFKNL